MRPLSEGQSTGCGSGSNYDRSRSGSFLLGCGFSVLACALASASLRRMEWSRFWINRCFVSAIKRRHSGSGMASSFRMVLSTISLVCWSRINGTISFSPARVYKCALSEFWDRAHYPRYSTIRGNFQIVAIYKDFKEISSDNVTTILESPATDSPFSVLQNFPFAGRTISRSNPGYACSQSPVKAQRTVRS